MLDLRSSNRILVGICLFAGYFMIRARGQGLCCDEMAEKDYDAYFDFRNETRKLCLGVSVVDEFIDSGCEAKGVLKLTVSKKILQQKRLLIDLHYIKPAGWVFDLGDSITNNGWGGDAGTQSRDAEFQLNGILSGHYSDFGGGGLAFSLVNRAMSRMTMVVGNEHTAWIPDCDLTGINYFTSPGWFALDGQFDTEGDVNYDIYLGINRVVSTPDFGGSGVCKVGIKFLRDP